MHTLYNSDIYTMYLGEFVFITTKPDFNQYKSNLTKIKNRSSNYNLIISKYRNIKNKHLII